MAEVQSPEVARELRMIRLSLFGLLCVGAVWVGLRISETIIRPPAPNWQELRDIQGELRQLREELVRQRAASQPPPVVIPVNPKADGGAVKGK